MAGTYKYAFEYRYLNKLLADFVFSAVTIEKIKSNFNIFLLKTSFSLFSLI